MQRENAQWMSVGANPPLSTIATNQESLAASSWMTVVGGALELQHTLYLRRPLQITGPPCVGPSWFCGQPEEPHSAGRYTAKQPWPR
jgi:hypothetical protein